MASLDQAPSENTSLLRGSRAADRPGSRGPSRTRFGISPEILLIPVALATRLAAQLPTTTFVELIRQLICKLWYVSQGNLLGTPEQCDTPEIARYFSAVVAIVTVTGWVIVVAECGILSRISSRYGRKPAFVLVLVPGIIGCCMIPGSQYVANWLSGWVFVLGAILLSSSDAAIHAYLVNMYVVDVCVPQDRTSALSKMYGWVSLGTCISYALGGFVTSKTGSLLIVFYISAIVYASTLTYVIFVLPESFPEQRRSALSRMAPEPSGNGHPVTPRFAPLHIFDPLKILRPSRKLDGTRNWRLAWCAAHCFVFAAINSYAGTAWLVLATSKYGFTPADTGIFLTTIAVSGTIASTVIVPPLVRLLRPYYRRKTIRSLVAEEDITSGEELASETSDRLDVHLAFVGCVFAAVCYLTAAASTTNLVMIFSCIFIGFGLIHTPTIRSLAAGSVHPLKQGEVLAAIEMISSAGSLLSPIVMGSTFTVTIEAIPLLVFYIHLAGVLISGTMLFPIRDTDRYQKSHEDDTETHGVN